MTRPPRAVREYMAKIGKKGGKASGARKKRSKAHYEAAAAKRWGKSECEHEWEIEDEGGGSSEFQPPDPARRKCILCGKREES